MSPQNLRILLQNQMKISVRDMLLMASTLVDTSKNTSIFIRIPNPTCDEKQIRQDAVLSR